MASFPSHRVAELLAELEQALAALRRPIPPAGAVNPDPENLSRALRFHLSEPSKRPILTAILGGTGTGKSTLLNLLVGQEISATSFRRTYTAGPVAAVHSPTAIPEGYLGLPVSLATPQQEPARGQHDCLIVVTSESPLLKQVTLIDTPDLDGDQSVHPIVADRVFRWAEAIVFVLTPEKYQMTEWLGYSRLAERYALPSLFVMNKAEEQPVIEDLRSELIERGWQEPAIFVVPRRDSAYEAPAATNVTALSTALGKLRRPEETVRVAGQRQRLRDLLERVQDQVLSPLQSARTTADQLLQALKFMRPAMPGVDVSGVTQQLRRRMQEQSILYLMGPQRMLDRVRQMPAMLARLPRTAWDLLVKGELPATSNHQSTAPGSGSPPDFAALLSEQLIGLQARVDDLLRREPTVRQWMETQADDYAATQIDPAQAGLIAQEELAGLQKWLQERWNQRPRDTRVVEKLVQYLPGGKHVDKVSELAPYLLTIVVATHGALFGPIDLLVIGGWSLATWLGERISNEVTARTRETNRRIGERFEALAATQLAQVTGWLEKQVPMPAQLQRLDDIVARLADYAGNP